MPHRHVPITSAIAPYSPLYKETQPNRLAYGGGRLRTHDALEDTTQGCLYLDDASTSPFRVPSLPLLPPYFSLTNQPRQPHQGSPPSLSGWRYHEMYEQTSRAAAAAAIHATDSMRPHTPWHRHASVATSSETLSWECTGTLMVQLLRATDPRPTSRSRDH